MPDDKQRIQGNEPATPRVQKMKRSPILNFVRNRLRISTDIQPSISQVPANAVIVDLATPPAASPAEAHPINGLPYPTTNPFKTLRKDGHMARDPIAFPQGPAKVQQGTSPPSSPKLLPGIKLLPGTSAERYANYKAGLLRASGRMKEATKRRRKTPEPPRTSENKPKTARRPISISSLESEPPSALRNNFPFDSPNEFVVETGKFDAKSRQYGEEVCGALLPGRTPMTKNDAERFGPEQPPTPKVCVKKSVILDGDEESDDNDHNYLNPIYNSGLPSNSTTTDTPNLSLPAVADFVARNLRLEAVKTQDAYYNHSTAQSNSSKYSAGSDDASTGAVNRNTPKPPKEAKTKARAHFGAIHQHQYAAPAATNSFATNPTDYNCSTYHAGTAPPAPPETPEKLDLDRYHTGLESAQASSAKLHEKLNLTRYEGAQYDLTNHATCPDAPRGSQCYPISKPQPTTSKLKFPLPAPSTKRKLSTPSPSHPSKKLKTTSAASAALATHAPVLTISATGQKRRFFDEATTGRTMGGAYSWTDPGEKVVKKRKQKRGGGVSTSDTVAGAERVSTFFDGGRGGAAVLVPAVASIHAPSTLSPSAPTSPLAQEALCLGSTIYARLLSSHLAELRVSQQENAGLRAENECLRKGRG